MIYLLAAAVFAALLGAWNRNVTAAALLASFAASSGMCHFGVPFSFPLWGAIDLAVIAVIIGTPDLRGTLLPREDMWIIVLFAPIWTMYLARPAFAPTAVDALVAAQMLLTFPMRTVSPASGGWLERFSRNDDNMRMAFA